MAGLPIEECNYLLLSKELASFICTCRYDRIAIGAVAQLSFTMQVTLANLEIYKKGVVLSYRVLKTDRNDSHIIPKWSGVDFRPSDVGEFPLSRPLVPQSATGKVRSWRY